MKHDLRLVAEMRREFSDWRLWLARGVVIAFAAFAGLTVVGFTWLTERALNQFFTIQAALWWIPCFGRRCALEPSCGLRVAMPLALRAQGFRR